MEIIEFEHPVARDILTSLRDRRTCSEEFRYLTYRISLLLAVESTRNIPTLPVSVETPLEVTFGEKCDKCPAIIPILRAGLGMLGAFQDMLPSAHVSFVALRRDEKDAKADWLYDSVQNLNGRDVLILDPMLATGGTASRVIQYAIDAGAGNISLVSIVASPEGVERLKKFEELRVITASVDRQLDENWYIRPGLGDFGDRLYSGNQVTDR